MATRYSKVECERYYIHLRVYICDCCDVFLAHFLCLSLCFWWVDILSLVIELNWTFSLDREICLYFPISTPANKNNSVDMKMRKRKKKWRACQSQHWNELIFISIENIWIYNHHHLTYTIDWLPSFCNHRKMMQMTQFFFCEPDEI